jgi:hypothetical protein
MTALGRTAVLVILVFCPDANPQFLYVGIQGGTPLPASTSSALIGSRAGAGLSTLDIRRYTVGPTFEIALPFKLRFEADALYKRLDRTDHSFLAPTFGNITREAANAWEFPLLLKYPFGRRRYSPFVAAGGTFRRIQSFDGSTETFAYGFQPPYSVVRYRINDPLTEGGMAFGAGMRIITVGRLKVTPAIRYTRWRSMEFLPTKNQVEFLVGLGL